MAPLSAILMTGFLLLARWQGAAAEDCPIPPPEAGCSAVQDETCTAIFSETAAAGGPMAGYMASLLAELAYDPGDGSSWEDKARGIVQQWGAGDARFVSKTVEGQTDTQAGVVDAPTIVFVFFRGTEISQSADIVTDLETELTAADGLGNVHAGFLIAEQASHDELTALIEGFRAGSKPVVFAGHSLGGALANIAAARQQQSAAGSVAAVYTYGSPRVGDEEWGAAYAGLGLEDVTYRYVMYKDPVPLLPPGSYGYMHVGTPVYLTSGSCQAVDEVPQYCEQQADPCFGWGTDAMATVFGLVKGYNIPIQPSDIAAAEPAICCAEVAAHSILGYTKAIYSTCLGACDQEKLCLCQTFFERPVAANAYTDNYAPAVDPSTTPTTYDTAVYTLTVTTGNDNFAGTDSDIQAYLTDADGRKTDTWTLDAGTFINDFEAGSSNAYSVGTSAWVDPASWELHIVFDGGLLGDDWMPVNIQVAASTGGSGTFCLVNEPPVTSEGWLSDSGEYRFTTC